MVFFCCLSSMNSLRQRRARGNIIRRLSASKLGFGLAMTGKNMG